METIKRVARLYSKLGMATPSDLIERRANCVDKVAENLKIDDINDLVRCILGIKISGAPDFIAALSEADPALDLTPNDKETAALAYSIACVALDARDDIAGRLALVLSAASLGGVRQPQFDDDALKLAFEVLAFCQSPKNTIPAERTYSKQPKGLTSSVQEYNTIKGDYSQANVHLANALSECAKYVESNALAAARSDNELLKYIKRLEEETRVQWWVTGGWSESANKPFRELSEIEAAIRAAVELEDKHSSPLGLFAAPALFDLLIAKGRDLTSSGVKSITAIATGMSLEWRLENFKEHSQSTNVDLLPLCSAMGIAAADEDAPDWAARFQRITQIAPSHEIEIRQLSLQLYRELLVLSGL